MRRMRGKVPHRCERSARSDFFANKQAKQPLSINKSSIENAYAAQARRKKISLPRGQEGLHLTRYNPKIAKWFSQQYALCFKAKRGVFIEVRASVF